MGQMGFSPNPGIVIIVTDVRCQAIFVSRKNGLSGKVGLASHGARSPAKNLNFCVGFAATEENSTGVTWSEVRFELKTT